MTVRGLARALVGALFAIAFAAAILEVALRVAPSLVGGRLANAVYSAYGPGGMYFQDPELRMNFMWPDFETRAYWNGYWWDHRTDSEGFRNPHDMSRESILLLGDSLIYGHGVQEEDTAAHALRERRGGTVYNMGRQGDCLYQEYVLARLYLPVFRPDTVVLFVFLNDFRDLEVYRQPNDIADPPEIDRVDYDAARQRIQHPRQRFKLGEVLAHSRAWRLATGVADAIRARGKPAEGANELMAPIFEDARYEPVARYYRTALGDLAKRTREQGADLVVVLLELPDSVIPQATAAQQRILGLLQDIGKQDGFRVLGTQAVFAGCPECFLPNDGHFTPEGHRRLAAFLDAELPRPAAKPTR